MRDDYFAENIGGNVHTIKKQSKKGVSVATLIFSLIGVAILTFILSAKWNDVLEWLGIEQETEIDQIDSNFSVGDTVELSGQIMQNGDMVNYTHTIETQYGIVGLKSSKLNLNNYSKEVSLEGFVEKYYQGIPVISVNSIYELDFEDELGQETEFVQKKYLSKLGMYFDESFFEKYSLINEGNGNSIKIKELDSNQIIEIQYFKCDSSSLNENCDKLTQNIGGQASQKFADNYGNMYFKQSGLESWFFTNGIYGYFINELQDSYVKALSKNIVLINKLYIEKKMLNILNLCTNGEVKLKNVKSSELKLQGSKLEYLLSGDDGNKSEVYCQLEVDPSLTEKGKLLKFDIKGKENEELTGTADENNQDKGSSEESKTITSWDPNVEQFPINLEKKKIFTSSRGHSFVFPSSNLSYKGFDSDENFDQAGVRCFSAMNVVAYTNSGALETDPSVVIYECSIKKGFDDSDQTLIYKQVGDKHFVIKILDSAWVNFANNIEIQA